MFILALNICWYSLHIFWYTLFANGPGDLGSIPGHVIPNTLQMVLDTFLLNTQQYKVRIKGKIGAILGKE